MRKIDLKKFTAVMTATAIVATNVSPTLSYDATPSSVFNTMNSQVDAGEYTAASQLVSKLKAMGVKFIMVAGKKIMLDDLGALLVQDTAAAAFMVRNLRLAVSTGQVNFGVMERIVTAPSNLSTASSGGADNFPISSMG